MKITETTRHCIASCIGFVTAIPIIVGASPRAQPSQDIGTLSYPAAIPEDAARAFFAHVRETAASTLDPALPTTPVGEWLRVALAPLTTPPGAVQIFWRVDFCDTPSTDLLCLDASVPLPSSKSVHVTVEAGAMLRRQGERVGWRPMPAKVRRIYIDRLGLGHPVDSLSVTSLAALPEALLVPTELWPVIDLATTITASTNAPLAGETVRFTIEVTNRGARRLERAWVHATGRREGAPDIAQDWFRSLDAGETARFEFPAVLPVGRATVLATATPAQNDLTYRGANGYVEPTVLVIGGGTWPRQ